MGSSPKTPDPTTEELAAQRRQSEELVKLDEEENERIKRLKRSRYSVSSNAPQSQTQAKSIQRTSGTPASPGQLTNHGRIGAT